MASPLLVSVNLAAKEDDEDAEINSMLGLDSFDLDMDDPVPAPAPAPANAAPAATRKPAQPTTSGHHSTGLLGISSTDMPGGTLARASMDGSGLMIGGDSDTEDGLEGGDAAGAAATCPHTSDGHGAAAIMEDATEDATYLSKGMDTSDSAGQPAEGQTDILAMEAVHEMADAGAACNAEFAGAGTAQGASGGGSLLQQAGTDAASIHVPGDVGQHSAPAPASVQHHATAGPVPADTAMEETAAYTAAGAAIGEAATGMDAAPSAVDATGRVSMVGIGDTAEATAAAGHESGVVVPSLR